MKMISQAKKYWPFVILGLFIIFLYTFNLEKNSRFIWDESRALVDMHRIWEQKQITFVGPISSDQLEMFPSLSYYMYMPATILSNFDPLGPAYMAAIYGVIAWIILTITFVKALGRSQKAFALSILAATIQPVMVASRWAWNPNPVIFWMSIFVATLFVDNPLIIFIGGVSLGASLYHHYLAALGVIPAILLLPILYNKNKKIFKKIITTLVGFAFAIIPFVIFESKNHFFFNSSAFLSANDKSFLSLSGVGYFERLWNALVVFSTMFVPENIFYTITFLTILSVIFAVYRRDNIIKYSFIAILSSLLLFGFVKTTYSHYQYVQVPLVILFLFRFVYFNKNKVWKIFLLALLFFSIYNAINQVKSYTWQGDIVAVRNVTKHISEEKNTKANVAALASPDSNLTGQRYRDMALISGKLLYAFDKYPQSEVLYVVSTVSNTEILRNDPAWEIESFKGSTITDSWKVSDFPMYLYRFEKL